MFLLLHSTEILRPALLGSRLSPPPSNYADVIISRSLLRTAASTDVSIVRGKSKGQLAPCAKKKNDNVWSIDNDAAASAAAGEGSGVHGGRRRRRRRRRPAAKGNGRGAQRTGGGAGRVLVSGAMLMEIETVLQTQEPVIKPLWDTFASSLTGIWKGVGAVFSPFTALMEPIAVGSHNENLYDCYTLSSIEKIRAQGSSQIVRKTNWVTLNPFGETERHTKGMLDKGTGYDKVHKDESSTNQKEILDPKEAILDLPSYGSFDFGRSDILEEDVMSMEPGLVFFEDGSYSRGPLTIPVGEFDESTYFLSPTFNFEQCLVKGCHKRLRIVHTIEFNEGGADVQITRIAIYEEQWASPVNLYDGKDNQFKVKPISQRRRTRLSELAGSWKVFEVNATPIFDEEEAAVDEGGPPLVYLCNENLKKRSLPETSVHFGEEEMLDMQDATVLWLPGGVTAYVDVTKDGILCIGVGWYSDEGMNLVMERDYDMDGKLMEVRCKTEVKRRWTDRSA